MSNRILLVEDDQSFGAVLKDYLSINNFDVTLAIDGELGLKEFTEKEFDICIFDVMMPKKSGFEVCEILRAEPAFSALRIIMLTAKGRDTEQAKGLALGADAYMLKPFSTKDLVVKIREILA